MTLRYPLGWLPTGLWRTEAWPAGDTTYVPPDRVHTPLAHCALRRAGVQSPRRLCTRRATTGPMRLPAEARTKITGVRDAERWAKMLMQALEWRLEWMDESRPGSIERRTASDWGCEAPPAFRMGLGVTIPSLHVDPTVFPSSVSNRTLPTL